MSERGAWIGFVVGACGLAMTVLVLARGGGYFVVVPRLAFVVPLAVVGAVTALAVMGVGRATFNAVAWLGVVALAGLGWNFFVYWLKFGNAVWEVLLPRARPLGVDFRDGLYDPARAFSTVHSGWPPLTLLLGRPFTLVSLSTGYDIQVCILVALALVAVVLSARLAVKAAAGTDLPGQRRKVDAPLVGLVMGLWLLTSYGFMYEIDRGNIDLYALVFSLLAVWLTIRSSRSAWLPAAVLALAIGLKLYPAILLVMLFWRYRWRALAPVVVTTAVALLDRRPGGPAALAGRLELPAGRRARRVVGAGLRHGHGARAARPHRLGALVGRLSAAHRAARTVGGDDGRSGAARLERPQRRSRRGRLCAADGHRAGGQQRLQARLCVLPLAVLAVVVATMERAPGAVWAVLFGAVAFLMIFLARSTIVVAPSLQASKYTLLVALQVLLLVVVPLSAQERREPAPAAPRSA